MFWWSSKKFNNNHLVHFDMSVFPPLRIVVPAKILICLKLWLKTGAHQVLLWSHHHHVVLGAKSGRRVLEHQRVLKEGGSLRKKLFSKLRNFHFYVVRIWGTRRLKKRESSNPSKAGFISPRLLRISNLRKFVCYLHSCKPGTLCVLSVDPGRKSLKYWGALFWEFERKFKLRKRSMWGMGKSETTDKHFEGSEPNYCF